MNEQIKETTSNKTINTRFLLHMLLTIGIVIGVAWFSNVIILSREELGGQYVLFTGVLSSVIVLCSLLERKKLYVTWKSVCILSACFLLSGLLLLLSDYYVNLPVWVLGGIIAAALVDRNIGMLYLYFFVYHAIYLQGNVINGLVFHFVVATMICLVIPKMKTYLSMFYMMAFTGCVIVTCSIINNRFGLSGEVVLDIFYILCTYLSCIFFTMLLVKWLGEKEVQAITQPEVAAVNDYSYLDMLAQDTAQKDESIAEVKAVAMEAAVAEEPIAEETMAEEVVEASEEPAIEETEEKTEESATEEVVETVEEPAIEETIETTEEPVAEETVEEPAIEETIELTEEPTIEEITETVEESIVDYTPYCDEKSELMLELRNKNKAVYAQSVLVGKLAAETASAMGLNAELTKAGGLYKRIGKIMDDATAETTTEIATVYEFPAELVELLDQLNHDIIARKEAAVLLLTDGVISSYSVMRLGQKNDISVEKIVDAIISKKIFSGEMNSSGLTMTECAALRERLVALLQEQDRRRIAKNTERKA